MGQIISTGWQPDHDAALREFIGDGLSYAGAASEINGRFKTSYSRNAAIGRANRIGLACPVRPTLGPKERKPREHKSRQRYSPESKRVRTIFESAETIQLRCVEIAPRNLSLMDLEPNDCRYPYGDGPFTFCGHPKHAGSSYCTPHHWLAHIVRINLSDAERERRRNQGRNNLSLNLARYWAERTAEAIA